MTELIIEAVKAKHTLTELSAGEFSTVKASGMTFNISRYRAEGLGTVSVMRGSAMLGLMKMDTVIFTPDERDLPLLSYDRIHAAGKDTLIIELYDTLLGECDLSAFDRVKEYSEGTSDHDLGAHWYDDIKLPESISKRGKKKNSSVFDLLSLAYVKTYIDLAETARKCDPKEKTAKNALYVEGLLKNGGPSTDAFKKAIGEEKTARLFRNVLFGTEQ